GLCPRPPSQGRITCNLCSASCRLADGSSTSYCGLRRLEKDRLVSLSTPTRGLLSYYLDPHVTNCCNSWFCPGGTGLGYPRYAVRRGPEYGFYNLALFLYGCSFDCLFCQNWEHKLLGQARTIQASDLVEVTLRNRAITCWCWFGGSPEPQLPFVLHASRRIMEEKPSGRVLRICYEWNGDGHPELVRRAAELAYESGGTVKFDLKAWTPEVHVALTGRDNKRALDNLAMVAEEFHGKGRFPPVLGASTLLVPGYVDEEEVEGIARFIASLSDDIPYTLLVFHPDFRMRDLPVTPEKQVWRCYEAARRHLRYVNVSNLHLLGYRATSLVMSLGERRGNVSLGPRQP
ncbi:MAG: radical SAM protein, partial [Candidatus Korarchaeota archaeon]|nr:radical SAM protein [Candidatus Korarchaeota archaeon]